MLSMKAIIAGGMAPRLRKDCNLKGSFPGARDSLLVNFRVRKKEQNDRLVQARKRMVKLNRLIRSMPR